MTNSMNPGRLAWTTHDECTFVKQLYEHRGAEWVRRYIESCDLRVRWDGIDPQVARVTARRLLAKCR